MLVTRQILPILKLFSRLSVIRRFYFLKQKNHFTKKVRVFPFYSRLQTCGADLKLHFRKTHPISLQTRSLKLLNHRSGVSSLILNTSAGLITHQEALRLGVGGVLVYTLR